ncbi:MAG TPA: hypothetical protein VFI29_08470 [Hanamia sp.]|nr:hypothetical protein [Hanamia sp.]
MHLSYTTKAIDKLIIKVVNPACQAFGQATYNADLYFPALRVKPSAFARNEAKIFLRIFPLPSGSQKR